MYININMSYFLVRGMCSIIVHGVIAALAAGGYAGAPASRVRRQTRARRLGNAEECLLRLHREEGLGGAR